MQSGIKETIATTTLSVFLKTITILIYSKKARWRPNFINDPSKRRHFKNPDNDPRGPWSDGNPVNNPGWRPNLQFNITAPNGNVIKHPQNGWRWSMETIEEKLKTGELRFSEDQTRLSSPCYCWFRDNTGFHSPLPQAVFLFPCTRYIPGFLPYRLPRSNYHLAEAGLVQDHRR